MKKSPYVLTLQDRMRGLFLFSVIIVLLVGIFGYWKIKQFHTHQLEIKRSSTLLQQNLQDNFEATRLLGNIHTNLRHYMQSADMAVLTIIRQDAQTLTQTLPKERQEELAHLQEIINVLAIRMASLDENDDQIAKAEQAISVIMASISQQFPPSLFKQLYPIASRTRGAHHRFYVSSVVAGQSSAIKAGKDQITAVIEEAGKQFDQVAQGLPREQQQKVRELKEAFYWLEESSTTVAAIRLTTVQTEAEIVNAVDKLKDAVAKNSLDRNTTSFSLMENGMDLAQQNILFLAITLVLLALLFFFTSYIISRNMIEPLMDFISLLQNMRRLFTTQRAGGCSDDSYQEQLASFIQKRRDEIGQVAKAIQDMLGNMQAISFFRQTIEADETTSEIYQRLARIFSNRLGLNRFIIYEKLRGHESMEHVYCQPPELAEEIPSFAVANSCRARRTGTIVSSYDDPNICALFPFHDLQEHYCIPMIVGGHVIGVVQFIFAKDLSLDEKRELSEAIAEAKNFIDETLPVLQSKHLASELEEMATKDQLTGLFNRRYLESSLDQLVAGVKRRGTNLGILMCDLDYFKQVNDNYGHDAGDAVLSQLAQVLLNSVRSADLVIRFGGEEFIILLMDCEKGKACDVAETIRQAVENHKFQASGQTLTKTTSIGVAEFPTKNNQGIWEAIKYADVALYKAKENGRNRVEVFEHGMWEENAY